MRADALALAHVAQRHDPGERRADHGLLAREQRAVPRQLRLALLDADELERQRRLVERRSRDLEPCGGAVAGEGRLDMLLPRDGPVLDALGRALEGLFRFGELDARARHLALRARLLDGQLARPALGLLELDLRVAQVEGAAAAVDVGEVERLAPARHREAGGIAVPAALRGRRQGAADLVADVVQAPDDAPVDLGEDVRAPVGLEGRLRLDLVVDVGARGRLGGDRERPRLALLPPAVATLVRAGLARPARRDEQERGDGEDGRGAAGRNRQG